MGIVAKGAAVQQTPGSRENLLPSREYVRKIYELTDFYNKVIIFCAITFIVSARQRDSLGADSELN